MIFADQAALAKAGRSFSCATCPQAVMERRRCQEDKWDFSELDEPKGLFPLQVHKGGNTYGFCPGKATWDAEVSTLFRALHVATVTGTMWESGALKDQPMWWIDLLSWFIQRYDAENFSSKARSVLGDGSVKNGSVTGKPKR